MNIGLDFSVWETRLSGVIEYFNKNTVDLLFNAEACNAGDLPEPEDGQTLMPM